MFRGGGAVVGICALAAWTAAAQTAAVGVQPETGSRWLARCGAALGGEAERGVARAGDGGCLAWIEGLLDMTTIYRSLGALDRTGEGFCPPASATPAEAGRAVTRYLQGRPSDLHVSARILAYMALREAFPCGGAQVSG